MPQINIQFIGLFLIKMKITIMAFTQNKVFMLNIISKTL